VDLSNISRLVFNCKEDKQLSKGRDSLLISVAKNYLKLDVKQSYVNWRTHIQCTWTDRHTSSAR